MSKKNEVATIEKLKWTRANWSKLKKDGKLEVAIEKIKKTDRDLDNYSVQDIIDIEESLPEYLQ